MIPTKRPASESLHTERCEAQRSAPWMRACQRPNVSGRYQDPQSQGGPLVSESSYFSQRDGRPKWPTNTKRDKRDLGVGIPGEVWRTGQLLGLSYKQEPGVTAAHAAHRRVVFLWSQIRGS